MSKMQELIDTANRLSNNLSDMAADERRLGWELCYHLEQLSYETYKTANDLRELINYYGVKP